ncbi:MAG: methionyl-tRNA formyltransferase, partial [Myxococcota bacterium]|nr:methionyl-tRNA formyltransferase [Myxococcota bacterium]
VARGEVTPVPQPSEGVTYAGRLRKEDGDIDWSEPVDQICCRVRAMHPWPGTRTVRHLSEGSTELLKLYPPASVVSAPGTSDESPGSVFCADGGGVQVVCGDGGVLSIGRLQAPGKRVLDAAEFLAGNPLTEGSRLG